MMRILKKTLFPAVLLASGALTGCAARLPVGTEPYLVAGEGGPAVVFDAGFGENRQTWRPVFPAIAAETTAFAFERPGYMAGPNVQNRAVVADDGVTTLSEQAQHLHGLLAAAQLAPPYVLVGHSVGGITLMAFAKYYPDEVAGIVFVDGRLPNFTAACAAAGIKLCAPPRESITGAYYFQAEFDGVFGTEATEAARVSELGDIPATFIVATRAGNSLLDREAKARQRVWMDFQRMSAESMRDGRYVEAVGAGHYVHEARPELVIAEIRNMLTRVRTGAWPESMRRE
jgi:pimeloyl-ACP methyl ester carboxylesterase